MIICQTRLILRQTLTMLLSFRYKSTTAPTTLQRLSLIHHLHPIYSPILMRIVKSRVPELFIFLCAYTRRKITDNSAVISEVSAIARKANRQMYIFVQSLTGSEDRPSWGPFTIGSNSTPDVFPVNHVYTRMMPSLLALDILSLIKGWLSRYLQKLVIDWYTRARKISWYRAKGAAKAMTSMGG